MDSSNLSFNIIPGEGAYEGGKSYFFPDMEAMPGFIEEVFNDNTQSEEKLIEDKTVTIEILNATAIREAAATAKEELEAIGYTVNEIGNSTLPNLPPGDLLSCRV